MPSNYYRFIQTPIRRREKYLSISGDESAVDLGGGGGGEGGGEREREPQRDM